VRILMCLGNPFPPDVRVEREARALAQAGHDIFVLSQYKEDSPFEENIGYATVLRRIPAQPFLKRAWRFAHMCFRGIDPLWQKHIADVVPKYNIEAVHVHDLPLVNTGWRVARENNMPVVADLHENYPEVIRSYSTNWRGKLGNMLMSKRRWQSYEKSWLERVDRVITVVDEIAMHFINDYGIPLEKVTVVMNVEDLDFFYSLPIKKDIVERYEPYFAISYVGGLGRHRGVQTAISAMPEIISAIGEARLVLVGSGTNEPRLRELAHELALDDVVEFTGWQPFELVPSYVAASQVCLLPYSGSAQTNLAPNKLFQYMAMGKPVIAASVGSLQRIIEETGAGLVYPPEDADALAEAVIGLHEDKNLADKLGKAGLAAVKTRYNWEIEKKKLIGVYQSL
jgi:glycosyltransferase involved in cell wall biosynthesis